jgi:hypothetical protein
VKEGKHLNLYLKNVILWCYVSELISKKIIQHTECFLLTDSHDPNFMSLQLLGMVPSAWTRGSEQETRLWQWSKADTKEEWAAE